MMVNTEMGNQKDTVNIFGQMDHIIKVTFIMVCVKCKESIVNPTVINTRASTKTIVNMDLVKYIILMGAFSKEHLSRIENKARDSLEQKKDR